MASENYRLSEHEFMLAWDARMKSQRRGIPPKKGVLYDVLVEGMTYAECGRKYGTSHQSVGNSVRRFMAFYNEYFSPGDNDMVPDGYVKETFTLPESVMNEVKELVKRRCTL